MKETGALAVVSSRDLNRRPAQVLERVSRGERFLVLHYGKPVATLQPVTGIVWQPFEGRAHDVFGTPVDEATKEALKLDAIEQEVLTDALRLDQIKPGRLRHREWGDVMAAVRRMSHKGLCRKPARGGWIVTGRGMYFRDILLARQGRLEGNHATARELRLF